MNIGIWYLVIALFTGGNSSMLQVGPFTDEVACRDAQSVWTTRMRETNKNAGFTTQCAYSGNMIAEDRTTQKLRIKQEPQK